MQGLQGLRQAAPAAALAPAAPRTRLNAAGGSSSKQQQRRQQRQQQQRGARLAVLAVAAPEALQAKKRPAFPFTRLAGQEDMKLALLLNVVDSSIGGVLIMGDRGTGKSVAVRSLVDLLPMIDVVQDDPFNSSPTGEGRLTLVEVQGARAGCPASLHCRRQWQCRRGMQCSVLPCGHMLGILGSPLPACRRSACPPASALPFPRLVTRLLRCLHLPADPKLMGPEALARYAKGEKLPATQMRTPLVELPLGATGAHDARRAGVRLWRLVITGGASLWREERGSCCW